MEKRRNLRKDLVGTVVSVSGPKTVKVVFYYKKPHALLGKEIKRKTVLHAHDEKAECLTGDLVEIVETRPLSKTKRFRVVRVVQRAPDLNL